MSRLSESEFKRLRAEHERLLRELEALRHDTGRVTLRELIPQCRALNWRCKAIETALFADIEARGGKRTYWFSGLHRLLWPKVAGRAYETDAEIRRAQFDGWTAEINSSCPPTMAAFIRRQPSEMAARKAAWIAGLRAAGVKAAHPDDGWVDRAANTVHLAYPQFGGTLEVGDMLALGYPGYPTRIVRVVELIPPGPIVAPLVPAGQPWAYRFEATS